MPRYLPKHAIKVDDELNRMPYRGSGINDTKAPDRYKIEMRDQSTKSQSKHLESFSILDWNSELTRVKNSSKQPTKDAETGEGR